MNDRPDLNIERLARERGAKILTTRVPGAPALQAPPIVAAPAKASAVARGKGSKFKNEPVIYRGVRYDSKAEARRAEQLDEMLQAGEILFWMGQPKFRLGHHLNVYKPDFLVVGPGWVRAEDVKGMETAKFKRDRKLWADCGQCPLWIIKGGKAEIITPQGWAGRFDAPTRVAGE